MEKQWYLISNVATVPSPAVVVYPDRIRANIQRAIQIVGDPQRLRPHIKTHKCGQIIRMHLDLGVTKFKCATIAEAEMAATAGAKDILVASQLVGPNLGRFQNLRARFPDVLFSTIVDSHSIAHALSPLGPVPGIARISDLPVYVDLNCGMDRTGLIPSEVAVKLYRSITLWPGHHAAGIHAYDGHIH